VAQARSFSAAARELSMTQPSVSQQVAALERELGTRLLDRGPGGLRLNAAGAVLLEHADVVAERLHLAGVQLAELARAERVRLRIGAFSSALAGLVPEIVSRLRALAPETKVMVVEGDGEELAEQVRSGRLHLAIAFQDAALPRREPAGAERRDVLHEGFLLALAEDHPLAAKPHVRIEELAGDDWTAASPDGLIVNACRAAGFEPRLVSLTRDPLAIRELVARGLAVTLAPALLTAGFATTALRPIAGPGPERDVYALLPAGGRHPLAEAAYEALVATAGSLNPILGGANAVRRETF
jgi:DNA-binding transcriptional LysR family regulator